MSKTSAFALLMLTGAQLADAARPLSADPVEVKFFTEALWPACRQAYQADIASVLKLPGLPEIMDLKLHPFGNAFYQTSACPDTGGQYSHDGITCWMKTCAVSNPPSDCFIASAEKPILCQHGATECQLNLVEGCAIETNKSESAALLICIEAHVGDTVDSILAECAKEVAGIDIGAITACVSDPDQSADVSKKHAMATLAQYPQRTGVPYLKVAGAVTSPADLATAVCNAYTGTPPPGCSSLAASSGFATVLEHF